MRAHLIWWVVVAGFVMFVSGPVLAQSPPSVKLPETAVIATQYVSADGCQATGRTVSIGIPNHEYLNLAFKDPRYNISGLSFRELTKVGDSGIRDLKFDPASGAFSFHIFAGGGGTMQCLPIVGCKCVGASGGSYGVEVTAHYKPTTIQHQTK
jgi:hypothetical protein